MEPMQASKAADEAKRPVGRPMQEVLGENSVKAKPEVRAVAREAARRAKKAAPVRWQFMERAQPDDPSPALARILRGDKAGRRGGGRGGEVRLKLLLSMLWMIRDPAPVLTVPSRAWASLLGLDDPAGRGTRRINEAIAWLGAAGFLIASKETGSIKRLITMRDETGADRPYELPGAVLRSLGPKDPRRAEHFYIQVPAGFWTNGWISLLSGAATSMLLLLLRLQANRPTGTELWFSPGDAKERFDLSDDTRSKGLRELTMAGLVTMERRAVDPSSFEYERVRNVYVLQRDRLDMPARILTDYDLAPWWGVAANNDPKATDDNTKPR